MNKKFIFILLVVFVVSLVLLGIFWRISRDKQLAEISIPAPKNAPLGYEESTADVLRKIFAEKYPKYAETIVVRINKETENHIRGGISMAEGAPGGNFLAVKENSVWKIVFDGNGGIPCSLSSYGFPAEMLSDCAE